MKKAKGNAADQREERAEQLFEKVYVTVMEAQIAVYELLA